MCRQRNQFPRLIDGDGVFGDTSADDLAGGAAGNFGR
jgi:hypothetical protein